MDDKGNLTKVPCTYDAKTGTVTFAIKHQSIYVVGYAPAPGDIAVTGVKIKSALNLAVGKSATLTPTVQPKDATNKKVTWSSKDKSIATVNSKGVVKGVKAGKTTITVTTADGKKTAACTVTVTVPVKSVKLNKATLPLIKGKTATLKATVAPNNATNKNVTWKSSNTKVAAVDKNGKITAKGKGTATITVTTADGKKTAECVVTVGVTAATKVKLNKTKSTIAKGKTVTLKATVSPSKADPKTVTWTSSNTKVATVNSKGVVKGVKAGKVTITATAWNGKAAKCVVTVK